MKFLYAGFVSDAGRYSGILKKVAGQTKGVAGLGWEAHYTFVSKCGVVLETGSGRRTRAIGAGLRWREHQKAVTDAICGFLGEEVYDAVYIKGFLATPYALRIAGCAKKANRNCRVIYEIATFPYWGEYRRFVRVDWKQRDLRSLAGHLLEIVQHALSAPRFRNRVDALVVFGSPVERLWGVPAVTVSNGVSVADIAPRGNRASVPGDAVGLLGVAGTSVAHGYDRVLHGMADYYANRAPGASDVDFSLVGENETITELKSLAEELHLKDHVHFLGYKDSGGLEELYASNDAAVSSLGVYRIGLTHLSPLKSREYCAAGIPFLYAYEDTLLSGGEPFALKLPNDASPVDMNAVAAFVRKCREDPGLPERERKFAEQNCDWKSIMKRILEFAEQADRL
jgi:glycosyltransferase involved in cell wall biosynthesis